MSVETVAQAGGVQTNNFTAWANQPTYPHNPAAIRDGEEATLQKTNATHFDPDDAPDDQFFHYRKLDLHNRDAWVAREDTKVWQKTDSEHHEHLIQSLILILELNGKQKNEAELLYDAVDRQKLGHPSELTGICCCILALESYPNARSYHPFRNDENNDHLFVKVAEDLMRNPRININIISSVTEKIRHRHL